MIKKVGRGVSPPDCFCDYLRLSAVEALFRPAAGPALPVLIEQHRQIRPAVPVVIGFDQLEVRRGVGAGQIPVEGRVIVIDQDAAPEVCLDVAVAELHVAVHAREDIHAAVIRESSVPAV